MVMALSAGAMASNGPLPPEQSARPPASTVIPNRTSAEEQATAGAQSSVPEGWNGKSSASHSVQDPADSNLTSIALSTNEHVQRADGSGPHECRENQKSSTNDISTASARTAALDLNNHPPRNGSGNPTSETKGFVEPSLSLSFTPNGSTQQLPSLITRGRGRGRPRGRSRGGGRGGKRKREHRSDGETSEDSEIYSPIVTTTKSGRSIQKPASFAPPPPPSPPITTMKRKRQYRRNPENAVCKVCFRGVSPATNMIVFCDGCNTAYHRHCHQPPIDQAVVDQIDKEWYCKSCQKSRAIQVPQPVASLVSAEGSSVEQVLPTRSLHELPR